MLAQVSGVLMNKEIVTNTNDKGVVVVNHMLYLYQTGDKDITKIKTDEKTFGIAKVSEPFTSRVEIKEWSNNTKSGLTVKTVH